LGTVRDQSGAVVPNAKVTLINEGTSLTLSKTSEADGVFIFTPIKIGTYTVEAEFQGFKKTSRPHVKVDVQQHVVVDLDLQPGHVTESVEVTAAVPVLQTQDASVGQVVGSREINDLPLNGRNFTFLAQLTAGVTVGHEDPRGLAATGSFTANGVRVYQNNYLLDGIDNNVNLVDFQNGASYVTLPSVDAIAEFKVQTDNYSAELGRAGGAVLNATIKSGTNQIHGDAWEFLRNDKLDAADFFQNANGAKKGEFRQNQFGFTLGGPVFLPHIYNGKNKTFFFMDYQGTRIRQAKPNVFTVPTTAERASGYTDFSDLVAAGGTPKTDSLGRIFPLGTMFDPATTRQATAGQVDPVTGLVASGSDYVRDPFYAGSSLVGITDFTTASQAVLLNHLPAGRFDPNAIKLLDLFPSPTGPGILNNFFPNRVKQDNFDSFDVRIDQNLGERDQVFFRTSGTNEPLFDPPPFEGIADGGDNKLGTRYNNNRSGALSYTHSFSPSMINEVRFGISGIMALQQQAHANDLSDIPGQFGIPGIQQVPGNGGLPSIYIGNYHLLGGSAFYPSNEFSTTTQLTENLTKTYKSHTFKGGLEFQHLKFATLQPAWSRGDLNFDGVYTAIPNQSDSRTGPAQLLLAPQASPYLSPGASGVDNLNAGADFAALSNMSNTDDSRNYYGAYFQDDWKVNRKLALNIGLRWDFFGQVEENFGAQANFIPSPPGQAQYLIPVARKKDPLSPSFQSLLAEDRIKLVYTDNPGLGVSQKTNFAPRFGFAYQITPSFVVRGGYGIFYGGFENRGYSPNLGENYPFEYIFQYFNFTPVVPIEFANPDGSTCGISAFGTGFTCSPLSPALVNGSGLSLNGVQYNYITPYTQAYNLTFGYQLGRNTAVDLGYVATLGRHLEVIPGLNSVSEILPPGTDTSLYVPFPAFGQNTSYSATEANSYYHSLQFKITRHFSNGLAFLGAYTWGKVRSDSVDMLDPRERAYRAPYLPHFGIQGEYSLAEFDVRQVLHFSGTYELPFGRRKHFLTNSSGISNAVLGGWSTNWVLTLQDGQPQTIGCTRGTSNFGCVALLVPGQNPIGGPHDVNHYYNAAAFTNPPVATTVGQTDYSPLGGAQSQVIGPGFHRLDWSLFKEFNTSESTRLQFRAEFFNLTNHPNFSRPSNTNFDDPNFGQITATRDNPNDPREIQFALKFYW
jgi:hypothetical protein